nr:RNA-directed DNA polymerase, eukaryota [Tanacetum cinerariifolium]
MGMAIRVSRRFPLVSEVHKLKDKGFDFWSHVKKRIGNESDTSFWSECWLGDIHLRAKYPCLFALEMDKEASVESDLHSLMESSFRRNVRGEIEQHLLVELTSMLESVSLLNSCDRWICDLTSDGDFRVKEVNVFTWRARQDCLPTRFNLVRRGINVESCVCPVCSSGEEDINHTLFRCDLAQQHGGPFGGLGTAPFLRKFVLDVRRSSTTLFFVLSIGVIVVVIKHLLGMIG